MDFFQKMLEVEKLRVESELEAEIEKMRQLEIEKLRVERKILKLKMQKSRLDAELEKMDVEKDRYIFIYSYIII